ncbi:MAG: lipoyl synthase [Acidimicrobiales bacterium]
MTLGAPTRSGGSYRGHGSDSCRQNEVLRVRWLGRVRYADARAVQGALHQRSVDDHLLLLEHPHTYTLGVRGDLGHVLVAPADVGAELVKADRGGDVTYHGPGQLVGYPILSLPTVAGLADTPAYVHALEDLLIAAVTDLGVAGCGRLAGYPGVWVDPDGDRPRKLAAIGVRQTRGRTMHGFALNVDPDLAYFGHIVPCGIAEVAVTSLAAEGVAVTMRAVVDAVVERFAAWWQPRTIERAGVVWRDAGGDDRDLSAFSRKLGPGEPVRLTGRLAAAGVTDALPIEARKPDFAVRRLRITDDFVRIKSTMRDLGLVTVCEEAGCPNIFECWADGTATFMLNGERCTRACGFCLVDTRKPGPLDADEPERVAEAVERMGLSFAVLTAVARDDLPDGGAGAFAETIRAIRRRRPGTRVEVLIPDCKGDPASLAAIFEARPDVLNHNLETVARLQRAVRPSASYARSLAVLARAGAAGLTTKSGLILGMGETEDEVRAALADLRGVGVDIVTLGQYLRPTTHHLPIARWVEPAEFDRLKAVGEAMGIAHVEASPLTRSSHHAGQALDAAEAVAAVPVSLSTTRSG